ncbi:hypothetical protein [Saprospira grandis]|uniref:Uncharacterized protein n=1 Tax=Saprospira grandis (strain Lewin) TaxID=984262 RepID=H6L4B8_SAPGL|nr:hypothetical protein [Saprospira grandis]AFC22797.1 hypothetical protein SGRA_0052 [Saprospira grandis str. Lewin]
MIPLEYLEIKEVDNQELFIIKKTFLAQVVENAEFYLDEFSPLLRRIFVFDLTEYGSILNLDFAFAKLGNIWMPYNLVEVNGKLQRIYLENISCSHCGWEGLIGNPSVLDAYIGAKNYEIPKSEKPCPSCKTKLSRHAFYIFR